MNPSASSISSALEVAGASFICFSVNPLQLPFLPHQLYFTCPESELFITNYCQNTAHTYDWPLYQPDCLFTANNKLCGTICFPFSDFLQNFISLNLKCPILAQWTAAVEVSSFCYHTLLEGDQLRTVGRNPLSFDAVELAVLQVLNGFLLLFDVDLIPVNRVELLWMHMQQQ